MSPNSRITLDEVKWLVWLYLGWVYRLASGHASQPAATKLPVVRCGQCGGTMHVVDVTDIPRPVFPGHALAYLDSG